MAPERDEDSEDGSAASTVRSVERTSRIISLFIDESRDLGVSEISRMTGFSKSSIHRTLTTLVSSGLLDRRSDPARYRLGPKLLQLALTVMGPQSISDLAAPIMEALAKETHETSTLSLRVRNERVYVAQVITPQDVRMEIDVGRRAPLYAGASGLAMLAYSPDDERQAYYEHVSLTALTDKTMTDIEGLESRLASVRERGFARSLGERDPWAAAVAAPIIAHGRVWGALSVCGPNMRLTAEVLDAIGPRVVVACAELSRRLPAVFQGDTLPDEADDSSPEGMRSRRDS